MRETKAQRNLKTALAASPGGFTHPDRIVQNLNIPVGASIADFGCGSGYFTLLLARLVGPSGKIFAIDVQQKALDVVRAKALDSGVRNITYTRANLEKENGSALADRSQDMVLLANILFQSKNKVAIVREACRVLRSGGELVMIDWLPETPFGPKDTGWKLSKEEGHALAQENGMEFIKEFTASINHWGLLFKKP